jgi:hypothetical protein
MKKSIGPRTIIQPNPVLIIMPWVTSWARPIQSGAGNNTVYIYHFSGQTVPQKLMLTIIPALLILMAIVGG